MYVCMDTILPVKDCSFYSSSLFILTWAIVYSVPQLVLCSPNPCPFLIPVLGCLSSVVTILDLFVSSEVAYAGAPYFLCCLWRCWSHSLQSIPFGPASGCQPLGAPGSLTSSLSCPPPPFPCLEPSLPTPCLFWPLPSLSLCGVLPHLPAYAVTTHAGDALLYIFNLDVLAILRELTPEFQNSAP